jgi:superfamily II DNA or RNA helicase
VLWPASPRILSENLVPVPEPLALALRTAGDAAPRAVAIAAARALLDGSPLAAEPWPAWLAPHQVPAARRLTAILRRYGGALLADDVGLGKSYVALAVALRRGEPFALVVPAVLTQQWRALLSRFEVAVPVLTHEQLSTVGRPNVGPSARLLVVDEAHRFRNPETRRYRTLAELAVGRRMLLLTATPVHNRIGDLFHLLRLFVRDHELAALGVPSLRRAALGEIDAARAVAAAARLIVARSRGRVTSGYGDGPVALAFPRHRAPEMIRVGPASDDLLGQLVRGIQRLQSGGGAAPLLRMLLLRRLASSLPAFNAALRRHDAYLDLTMRAQTEGRRLTSREFVQLFPDAAEPELQLVLFPLLLEDDPARVATGDRRELARLRALTAAAPVDPKASALRRLLEEDSAKTIVFTDAVPTVRHLLRILRHRCAGAVFGHAGLFATGPANRAEVLRAFAPRAQHAPLPASALRTDTLVATDLLSEGLNLQDARRVVHYDLPWSPARLSQRVGRIDRLDSTHQCIETVTFLPPAPLADAIAIEERLAAKSRAQIVAGSAGSLDWCDRLDAIAQLADTPAPSGACAAVSSPHAATVLVVRIGALVEAIAVRDGQAIADPVGATEFLEEACRGTPVPGDAAGLNRAILAAAPLVRARLNAVQDSRWRAADRDQLARRLIPWVLSAARRAARRGDSRRLDTLDAVVSRLARGMTAGEELLLNEVLSRRSALTAGVLCDWHASLPPLRAGAAEGGVELVAAIAFHPQ